MAADALIQCRVTSEMKTLLRSITQREQITESALVRQLLETMVRTSAAESCAKWQEQELEARDARLSIRPEDRLLLSERAAARGMPAAMYVAVLVRSHLRKLTPLPRDELTALKQAVAELGAIGRNLEQIARAANQGARIDSLGHDRVMAMLKVSTGLRDHVKALLKANEASWERGHADATHSLWWGGAIAPHCQLCARGPQHSETLTQSEIELIRRTVRRGPEVMVKVLSRGGSGIKAVGSLFR